MSYTLTNGATTLDLGYVDKESIDVSSDLMVINLPGSNAPFIFDFFGAKRSVTISGRKLGTLSAVQTFITSLTGFVNGAQTPSTYSSDILPSAFTSGNSYVESVSIDYELADVKIGDVTGNSIVAYTVTLQIATTS